jgi:hypothetical protein
MSLVQKLRHPFAHKAGMPKARGGVFKRTVKVDKQTAQNFENLSDQEKKSLNYEIKDDRTVEYRDEKGNKNLLKSLGHGRIGVQLSSEENIPQANFIKRAYRKLSKTKHYRVIGSKDTAKYMLQQSHMHNGVKLENTGDLGGQPQIITKMQRNVKTSLWIAGGLGTAAAIGTTAGMAAVGAAAAPGVMAAAKAAPTAAAAAKGLPASIAAAKVSAAALPSVKVAGGLAVAAKGVTTLPAAVAGLGAAKAFGIGAGVGVAGTMAGAVLTGGLTLRHKEKRVRQLNEMAIYTKKYKDLPNIHGDLSLKMQKKSEKEKLRSEKGRTRDRIRGLFTRTPTEKVA